MSISAQRFNFLDQQTNVPVTDFTSINTTDLLNTPQNDLKVLSTNLSNLVNSNAITPIKNALASSTSLSTLYGKIGNLRITKDFFSSSIDHSLTSSNILTDAAQALAGTNPNLSTSLSQLGSGCTGSLLNNVGARVGQNPLISCGLGGIPRRGSLSGCNVDSISNIINAAANGAGALSQIYTPNVKNGFALENATTLLGLAGYKSSLCGVYGALTNGLTDVGMMTRISSTLIGATASKGDILSVVDIGKNLTNESIPSVIPGVSSLIFSNYSSLPDITNSQLPTLYSALSGSMNKIDPNWCTDPSTSLISSMNLGGSDASNYSDISDLLTADASNIPAVPTTDGSVSNLSTSGLLLAGNQFAQSDPISSLSSMFG